MCVRVFGALIKKMKGMAKKRAFQSVTEATEKATRRLLRDPKHLMTPGHITDDAPQCIHEMFLVKCKKNETGNSLWATLHQLTAAAISRTSLESVFGLSLPPFSPKNDVDWSIHIEAKRDSD